MITFYKTHKINLILFIVSIVSSIIGLILNILHYKDIYINNGICGWLWLGSIILFILSIIYKNIEQHELSIKSTIIIISIISTIYFISHLFNYSIAPWNDLGLFDDAAWDIYHVETRLNNFDKFEIIFNDIDIGNISRELLFHYYIKLMFILFGYNLHVFNISLIILGYITVLFTTLLTERITKNKYIAISVGIILNFLPLHFTQVFMGHRYAICTPVLMISIYYIYRAFTEKRNKLIFSIIGGIFAGLTLQSAIMGKQYIYALIIVGIIHIISKLHKELLIKYNISLHKLPWWIIVIAFILNNFIILLCAISIIIIAFIYNYIKINKNNKNFSISYIKTTLINIINQSKYLYLTIISSFIITIIPLISYISVMGFNCYNKREIELTNDFFNSLFVDGFNKLIENLNCIFEVLFFKESGLRQFSNNYPILNIYLVVLLVIGIIILGLKYKFYTGICLIIIPIIGNIIATCYDFRLLICAPFIALSIGISLSYILNKLIKSKLIYSIAIIIFTLIINISPIKYLYELSNKADSQTHLDHFRTIECRYIQNIVSGNINKISLINNEFNNSTITDQYDVFAGVYRSYAHIRAFLANYDHNYILSLFNNRYYEDQSEEDIINSFINCILDYEISNKDLKLVFTYNEKLDFLLEKLSKFDYISIVYDEIISNNEYEPIITMVNITISNHYINQFKQDINSFY